MYTYLSQDSDSNFAIFFYTFKSINFFILFQKYIIVTNGFSQRWDTDINQTI